MDYTKFDEFIRNETKIAMGFVEILSKGAIFACTNMEEFDPIISLERISDKVGLYMHWVEYDSATDNEHVMECVYVGKGNVQMRSYDHATNKIPQGESVHVTFFECENRIAKYLEQLILDLYRPRCNEHEVYGTEPLRSIWTDEWFDVGKASD